MINLSTRKKNWRPRIFEKKTLFSKLQQKLQLFKLFSKQLNYGKLLLHLTIFVALEDSECICRSWFSARKWGQHSAMPTWQRPRSANFCRPQSNSSRRKKFPFSPADRSSKSGRVRLRFLARYYSWFHTTLANSRLTAATLFSNIYH